MIPHYRPPYSLRRVLRALVTPWPSPSIEDLERAYAVAVGAPEAVIVPSVRSGILLLIRAAMPADGLVIGPAFTCMVVHEAMLASGRRTRYVDPTPGTYEISPHVLERIAEPGSCLILSELYGMPYSESVLSQTANLQPALRIIDSAMGIPNPSRLRALQPHDAALFSFGMGKCLCAGGGGIAFLDDRALASRVRELRDEMLAADSLGRRMTSDLIVVAGNVLRTRAGARYATARRQRVHDEHAATGPQPRSSVVTSDEASAAIGVSPARQAPAAKTYISREWTHVMTPLERRLAQSNLPGRERSARLRAEQARRYLAALAPLGITTGVDRDRLPQSHFPIRVPATQRTTVRTALFARGVDCGTEFELSGVLRTSEHPGTVQVCDEVLTLPLGEGVSLREIEQICGWVKNALSAASLR